MVRYADCFGIDHSLSRLFRMRLLPAGRIVMKIPRLGEVTRDERFGCYYSKLIPVPMLGGKECRIILEGYDEDESKNEFHIAITNFLSGTSAVLRDADESLFRYYKDHEQQWLEDGRAPILSPEELWQHVRLGNEPTVSRRHRGDWGIYISIECDCDWEAEHGLQFVLYNGLRVNKLGSYDGHLANSDAFDDERLENVIYKRASL